MIPKVRETFPFSVLHFPLFNIAYSNPSCGPIHVYVSALHCAQYCGRYVWRVDLSSSVWLNELGEEFTVDEQDVNVSISDTR